MNISYVDVRRDFARRTDCDATNSSRKYPYIATYPISLFFFCVLSSLRLVFFFIGHWMYHCPCFHVMLDQCETMFRYDDTEMVRRFFFISFVFSWRNARCVRVEDRCAFECTCSNDTFYR